MATSGVIEKSFHNGYRLRIEWSQSKDIANNRSTINCKLYVVSTGSGYKLYSSSRPVNWSIDGSGGTFNAEPVNNNGGQKSYLGSFSRTVNHNADGSKSASISASWNFNGHLSGTYYGTITASGTANLDSIARASTPTLSKTSFNMGETITIYTNRASTSFTHTIKYTFGNASGTIATNVGASTTWSVPLSLANQIPNSVTGTGHIQCETYHSGKLIGTKTIKFYATVPSNVVPTLKDFYVAEHNSAVSQNNIGAYVQNLSQLRIEVWSSHITTAYGSAIKSYKIEFDGKTWNSWAATTNVLTKSGNLNIKVTITDGRGRSASRTKTISVIAYSYPKITSVNVERTNSSGQNNPLGEYAKITFSGSFSSLTVGGTQKNTATWRVYSRERGASSWGSVKNSGTVSSGTNVSPSIPIASGYSNTKSYEFRFEIQDKFGTTLSYFVLSSGRTIMSISKDGVGIGKIWEKGALDVGGTAYFEDWQMQNVQWYNIPLLNGAQPYSEGETPQWARFGDFIVLRGAMKNILARGTQYASLPAEARPTKSINFSHNTSHDQIARFARWQLFSDGRLVLEGNSDSKFLDWHWYPIHIVYCRNQG